MENQKKVNVPATVQTVAKNATGKEVVIAETKHIQIAEQATKSAERREPTIEELAAKAERQYFLTKKIAEIREKAAQVTKFGIVGDWDSATITICDKNKNQITTTNPQSINAVLAIWKNDLHEIQQARETELRDLMTGNENTQSVELRIAA